MKENIFIFDVESTSLYGEAFAFSAVVADGTGKEIAKYNLKSIEGEHKASDWVKENVCPQLTDFPTCETQKELRDSFFAFYKKWVTFCDIWCDCGFPVETSFLTAIANDDIANREFEMPYPLHDLGTIMDVNIERENKQKHNPYYDSKIIKHNIAQ